MALLADYAITPDVFDVTSYPTEGECAARLETIREAMLTEGLVRDLRDGAWSGLFRGDARPWHRRGQELLKKMATQGRLLPFEPALPGRPADDCAWCAEALATDDRRRLDGGVIATESVKQAYAADPRVARIDRLSSVRWWASRSPSVRLGRTVADYEGHLDPVLRFSNSLVFIDPHLDPSQPRYGSFGMLLQRAGNRAPVPRVEIHRVCYEGSGPARRLPMREDPGYFRRAFRDVLARPLRDAGLGAEVFIWSDFHDRYLVSNLVGISLPNGFDVPGAPGAITTWTRLGRGDRDDVQREFDPGAGRHGLVDRFDVRP